MFNIDTIIKCTSSLNLLYVEDNQQARESTIFIFEEFFTNIKVAINGQDGLEKFKEGNIDIIITDINMPKMNGLEMIKEIRKFNQDIPILVLSAYNESGFFMDSIKLGVEGYLLKPIDMEQFSTILQKVIEKLELQNQLENNLHLLHQYQEITDKSSIVSKTDLTGVITYVNDAFCEISGYSKEELIGFTHSIIRHPDNQKEIFRDMWDTIKKKKSAWEGIVRNLDKSGKSYYVKAVVKPILDRDGNILEYIALRNDITSIMSPKKQLQDFVNSHDETIVVFVQIEQFENIEKFYGINLAQKIEDNFSEQILDLMPKECGFSKVFVLGNGEYIFARELTGTEDVTIDNLKQLQSNINELNLHLDDLDYDVSVVISVSYGKEALSNARYGMKKLLLLNQDFIIANDLTEEEHDKALENFKTLKMVKMAIENFKIVSFFQPIINNKTKEIEKYESLVRLIDQDGKVVSPFFFLDTAKQGKYYHQITSMVLDNSFSALKHTNMDITINLSVLDIEKYTTREKIFELLEKNKKDLYRVVFELLED